MVLLFSIEYATRSDPFNQPPLRLVAPPGLMDSISFMRLERDFGSFNDWQRGFIACCTASRCGWAVTYLNMYTQKYMNCVIDLHSEHVPVGFYPIIVMDVWQHAYYRDYLKNVKMYTAAMMKELNWKVIENRFIKADKILQVIRG